MTKLKGSCYCENITVDLQVSKSPGEYKPRACDCNFCMKHGASYISDPAGTLSFHVKDMKWLRKFRQDDDGIADFLHCINCGVYVGVIHQDGDQLFGAVNSLVIDEGVVFGEKVVVSPKQLSDEEKIKRWKEIWFRGVRVFTNVTFTPPL